MFQFLAVFNQSLQVATWLVLLATGIWLYLRLRLRSLPWLCACAGIIIMASVGWVGACPI